MTVQKKPFDAITVEQGTKKEGSPEMKKMSSDGTNRRKNEQERNRTNEVRGFGGVVKLGHVCTLIVYPTNDQSTSIVATPPRLHVSFSRGNSGIDYCGAAFLFRCRMHANR